MDVQLAEELATFRQALPTLLVNPANRGRFALMHGDQVAGLYPTVDAALYAGYEKFELAPFLVMEVAERVEPLYFSRNLECPSSVDRS